MQIRHESELHKKFVWKKETKERERERKDGQYWAIIGLASFSA